VRVRSRILAAGDIPSPCCVWRLSSQSFTLDTQNIAISDDDAVRVDTHTINENILTDLLFLCALHRETERFFDGFSDYVDFGFCDM
jgi:hypothetical protein